jgi:LmbE family N-acetylglucosaminyl deacetylase
MADRWEVIDRWPDMVAQMRAESGGAPFLTRWSGDRVGGEAVTAEIDVSPYVEAQHAALVCHRTQFPPDSWWLTMPTDARRVALGTSRLARLYPRPAPGEHDVELLPGGPTEAAEPGALDRCA